MEGLLFIALLLALVLCLRLNFKLRKQRRRLEAVHQENTMLIADNALLQADQLRYQLEPHTLKNILANLQSAAFRLNRGMESLAGILDYILYKGKTHLVSIEQEIGFIKGYLELNDNFTVEIDSIVLDNEKVDRASRFYQTPSIPHLITVYFIENAFAHGDRHHPDFLRIRLSLTGNVFELHVVNRMKGRAADHTGGIGLQNMEKRLDLLLPGRYGIQTRADASHYHSTLTIQL